MANERAIRTLAVRFCLLLLGTAGVVVQAQAPPFAPFSPRSPAECQTFASQVEAYAAAITEQHEQCLATHKVDRPNEGPDSLLCSRSTCQFLHDQLYGNSPLSAKSLRKEVPSCYSEVNEYLAEQAKKAKEQADEEAAEKQRADQLQAEERQLEAEQKARAEKRENDEADREAQDNQEKTAREARNRAEEQTRAEALKRAEAARIAELSRENQYSDRVPDGSAIPATSQHDGDVPLLDPFGSSNLPESGGQEVAANENLVDPFPLSEEHAGLVDPFSDTERSHSPVVSEETWNGSKEIFEGFIDKAEGNLDQTLKEAQKEMRPEDFAKFEKTVGNAHSYLVGLSKTITVVSFQADVKKIIDNPGDPGSYRDIISDSASYGFSYVLKRLSPDFLSKIYEGPAGWIASITFDSSSTQTPKQDFDPMTALNSPGQYTFQQREAALNSLYESAQKHPETWGGSRARLVYSLTERLYNSPDNPNIHLIPPSQPVNPNINLTPP